jgi:hypothetical protein
MCPICQSALWPYLQTLVLRRYQVQYFRCAGCGFITTEPPYWLEEAYSEAITSLDIGLPHRNIQYAPVTEAVIRTWFNPSVSFMDFGGGYGLFVRLMRDRGFDFYWQDRYCENLFAKSFEATYPRSTPYALITAFEVLEHVPDPAATVAEMLTYGDSILFSTELQPTPHVAPANWWYFTPETGQHLSLYTETSLQRLADRLGLRLYTNGRSLHLFTRKKIQPAWFRLLTRPRLATIYNYVAPHRQRSLLDTDFDTLSRSRVGT